MAVSAAITPCRPGEYGRSATFFSAGGAAAASGFSGCEVVSVLLVVIVALLGAWVSERLSRAFKWQLASGGRSSDPRMLLRYPIAALIASKLSRPMG
jgi:hypothetical protein